MSLRLLAVAFAAVALLSGCGNADVSEAEKPVGTTATINNDAPEAKTAPGAPAPESAYPPPGGAKTKKK